MFDRYCNRTKIYLAYQMQNKNKRNCFEEYFTLLDDLIILSCTIISHRKNETNMSNTVKQVIYIYIYIYTSSKHSGKKPIIWPIRVYSKLSLIFLVISCLRLRLYINYCLTSLPVSVTILVLTSLATFMLRQTMWSTAPLLASSKAALNPIPRLPPLTKENKKILARIQKHWMDKHKSDP